MAKRIEDFVKRRGPLSERQVDLVREWLAEDWESKDIDSNAVALISRLVDTIWEIDCIKKGQFAEFKIRDKDTGLWSSGGWGPHFGPVGKSWETKEQVRAHLKMLERGDRYHDKMRIPGSWEVVEFSLTKYGPATPARSLLGRKP